MGTDNLELDPAVLAAIPKRGKVISIIQHGQTNWSTGYKVDVETEDKVEREYFLKIFARDRGDEMALAEFESLTALSAHIPDNIQKPLAHGTLELDPTKAFFLTDFRHLLVSLPPISELMNVIKDLHQSSESPTGKFGFHVTSFYGPPAMDNTWTDSWEEYFTRDFWASVAFAQTILNDDEELAGLAENFIRVVIPRLLRPLQTGGRTLKPVLCHGDLCDSNVQIDILTNRLVLFDPCCFYGHNEMDFQCMRASRNAFGSDFVNAYKNEYGASEPKADFDDRNTLYALRNDLQTIGMWPQWKSLEKHVKSEMRRLLEKHPQGIDGFKDEV